jgi:Fic family protein
MSKQVIEIPQFGFDNALTGLIVELERVREKFDHGTTSAPIFFELKNIFQLATSMTSARIEGNHTTVVDFVDAVNDEADNGVEVPDEVREITNIQAGVSFIEQNVKEKPINKEFICQLHRIVVEGLVREGDERPGAYRNIPVTINKSSHRPPAPADVGDHMDELVRFINEAHGSQFDLLKDAIVHHRFTWIHPFTNGNGRVARLLTYAMMAKQGFIDASGIRALNPTAVFGSNREEYYDHLSKADSLKDDDVLAWSFYMLNGVKADLDKVASLQDASYVLGEVLEPALREALERKRITPQEFDMLRIAIKKNVVQAGDFSSVVRGSEITRTRAVAKLKENRLLRTLPNSPRRYQIQLSRNAITTPIMKRLVDNGILPPMLAD